MDFLLEAEEEVQREVFFATSSLLNLEVDLLFFDTTSTYFEIEEEDADTCEGPGYRKRGYSRDRRPDLPQVVIGLAVTREGLPVRCWSWPGNTHDATVIPQVKQDLVGWKLGRVITVVDAGFTSEANLRTLQRAGGHYIAGEKLRSGKPAVEAALRHPGRYQVVRDNLEVKEIIVGRGEGRVRYILVYNPQEARRDRQKRADLLRRLRQELRALPTNAAAGQALLSHPAYRRYLSVDRHGRPFIDPAKVREEARYDGKYLVRTSDDTLAPEDVALGYKQLLEVEEAFRTLKHTLDIRPVHHRREERIRAHVLLCWLALLLVRVVELRTGQQWPRVRQILQRMHLGTFVGPSGQVQQRTEVTADQHRLFTALRIPEPPRIFHITTKPPQKKVP
jgi:transposase